MRFRAGDDVRAVWLLAVCILVTGSFYVQTHYQRAIRGSHERTETLYRRTVANTRLIRSAATLRNIEQRAEADLRRLSHDSSLSGTTANLLSMLHICARAFDTRILEVQPGNAVPAAAAGTGAKAVSDELAATALTMRVRGRFRNILGFVEDLSHHATLLSVSDTEMTLSNDAQGSAAEPRLDATIRATLYRFMSRHDGEVHLASAE